VQQTWLAVLTFKKCFKQRACLLFLFADVTVPCFESAFSNVPFESGKKPCQKSTVPAYFFLVDKLGKFIREPVIDLQSIAAVLSPLQSWLFVSDCITSTDPSKNLKNDPSRPRKSDG
jgi:hypothetical protein